MKHSVGFENVERQDLDEIAKKIRENRRKSLRKLTQTASRLGDSAMKPNI